MLQRSPNSLIIGAAIGTGIAARAAIRGGADFLLAVNSARFRMMGASSVTGHVAVRNNNSFVESFAAEELLFDPEIPVFFGAAVFDPSIEIERFVTRLRETGFAGLANSRSAGRYTGTFRSALERAGLGIERDLELFEKARQVGLCSLAYARNQRDAHIFAKAGVDMLCLSFGPNSGEFGDAPHALPIEDATELARQVVRSVRKESPRTLCLVTGAPIIEPVQMLEVCGAAKADGYIGGSTIDRLPLQQSIESRTAEFKQAILRHGAPTSRRRRSTYEAHHGIVAESAAMQRLLARMAQILPSDLALFVHGPEGAGKTFIISCLTAASPRARRAETLPCRGQRDLDQIIALSGCAAGAAPGIERRRIGWLETLGPGTLVLADIDQASAAFQDHVAEIWKQQRYRPLGSLESAPLATRLVCTSRESLDELWNGKRISRKLHYLLRPNEIIVPGLAARTEDFPRLIAYRLGQLHAQRGKGPTDIDQAAVRSLQRREWAGNAAELFSFIDQIAMTSSSEKIVPRDLRASQLPAKKQVDSPQNERDWILEALRRHRYRRRETADYLGITRKTLFNKMKRYSIAIDERWADQAP